MTNALSKIHWVQAANGRLRGQGGCSCKLDELAGAFGRRLQKELDSGALPFIKMPFREKLEKELPEVMSRFGKNFKHMLLLGIGGSALGPRALQKAFAPEQDWPGYEGPWLWIADNVDASVLQAWMDRLPPKDTLVVVISKSGGTIETMGQYFIVRSWLEKHLGSDWKNNVLAITDEKSGALRDMVQQSGLPSLPVPDNLGGRYSVLSAVGLVPAYFMGMDWKALLRGSYAVTGSLAENPLFLAQHPAWKLANWAHSLIECDYSQLIFFCYVPSWACFGAWFGQLWAESLGKSGQGSMPLPAVGVTDQHSLLQMFLDGPKDKGCLFLEQEALLPGPVFGQDLPDKWSYLRGKPFSHLLPAEAAGTLGAFAGQDIPLVKVSMADTKEEDAGRLMALLELTTVLTGWLLDIDPIDQPAVEYGKRLANARLGASGYAEEEKIMAEYFARTGEISNF